MFSLPSRLLALYGQCSMGSPHSNIIHYYVAAVNRVNQNLFEFTFTTQLRHLLGQLLAAKDVEVQMLDRLAGKY